jgi:hypothetical protein
LDVVVAQLRSEACEQVMAIVMKMHHRDFSTRLHLQEFHQGNVTLGYMLAIPMRIDTPREKYRVAFMRV